MTPEPSAQNDGIPVDEEFFEAILPRVRDLAELKVILHVIRLAAGSEAPAVSFERLLSPALVASIAGGQSAEPGVELVRRAVAQALGGGHLLRVTIDGSGGPRVFLLASTATNRNLVEQMRNDEPNAEARLGLPPSVSASIHRPNIFSLYEQNIGPLTPLVADQLREAERSYPRHWIEAAIQTAVEYRRRNWRYIQAILTRWEEEGAPESLAGRN